MDNYEQLAQMLDMKEDNRCFWWVFIFGVILGMSLTRLWESFKKDAIF